MSKMIFLVYFLKYLIIFKNQFTMPNMSKYMQNTRT